MPTSSPTPSKGAVTQPRDEAGRLLQKYDVGVMADICVRVASGETLTAICKEKNQPTTWTFRNWVLKDETIRAMYTQARELKAHSLFDEALDLAREVKAHPGSSQQVRAYEILINHLRWAAGKLNARDYSERSSVRFIVPIQINTTIDLAGNEVDPDKVYDLTAEVVVDPEEAEKKLETRVRARQTDRKRWARDDRQRRAKRPPKGINRKGPDDGTT